MSVRRQAALVETVHAVVYFAPEVRHAMTGLGLRGYWRGYFAQRAAPLGAVGPERVTELFGGFAPAMVARAIPEIWSVADPAAVVHARRVGVDAALARLLGDLDLTEPAALAREAVDALDTSSTPLAAAQPARPATKREALWRDLTVLREHRGDVHLEVLRQSGLTWPEPHLLLAGLGRLDPQQQEHRGWTDAEWGGAARALEQRGWLRDGRATDAGAAAYERLELETDAGTPEVPGLAEALEPLARRTALQLPFPNAMGLPQS